MKILVDTTILIDALRARGNRRELLAKLVREGHDLYTTALNIAEVYGGMRSHEQQGTDTFLAGFSCFGIDRTVARSGGLLKSHWARKGPTLTIIDCTVGAVAIQNNCPLATDNRKDFPMPEIQLYPLP